MSSTVIELLSQNTVESHCGKHKLFYNSPVFRAHMFVIYGSILHGFNLVLYMISDKDYLCLCLLLEKHCKL